MNTSYQWNAEDYARHSGAQYQWAQELIAKLHLQGNETILDIGCGDGKITAGLAAAAPQGSVTGVDLSDEMIALAARQFPPADFPHLRFKQMDAAQLRFQSEFDVAFSNAALHWVKDHRPVLKGVQRALKPGGRLLFQMGGQGNAADIVTAMDRVRVRPEWAAYFTGFEFPYGFYGPDIYRDLLSGAGLTPLRIDLIPKDMAHAGRAGLGDWLRTTWMPYTSRVPQEQREVFLSQVIADYLNTHPADEQGMVHVQMVRLEVEAKKETEPASQL